MSEYVPPEPRPELGTPRTPQSVAWSDRVFYVAVATIGATYVLLIVSMLVAPGAFMRISSGEPATTIEGIRVTAEAWARAAIDAKAKKQASKRELRLVLGYFENCILLSIPARLKIATAMAGY